MPQSLKIFVYSILAGQGIAVVNQGTESPDGLAEVLTQKYLGIPLDSGMPLDKRDIPKGLLRCLKELGRKLKSWEKDDYLALVYQDNAIHAYGMDSSFRNRPSMPAPEPVHRLTGAEMERPISGWAKLMRLKEARAAQAAC